MSENAGLIKKTLFEVYFISLKANKYKWNNYSVIVNDLPSRCDVITVFFPVSFTHWKCWVFWMSRKQNNSNNEN